jgi:hypothetical protein
MLTLKEQTNNSNDWIKKAIAGNYIKYYDPSQLTEIKEIENGCSSVGEIFRANWKETDNLLVVKSPMLTDEEIVNEVQYFFCFVKLCVLKNLNLA